MASGVRQAYESLTDGVTDYTLEEAGLKLVLGRLDVHPEMDKLRTACEGVGLAVGTTVSFGQFESLLVALGYDGSEVQNDGAKLDTLDGRTGDGSELEGTVSCIPPPGPQHLARSLLLLRNPWQTHLPWIWQQLQAGILKTFRSVIGRGYFL